MGTVYNDEQGQAKALFQLAYRLASGQKGPEDEGEIKRLFACPIKSTKRRQPALVRGEGEK